MCSKTGFRKERGTRGQKVVEETSPRSERVGERGMDVTDKEGLFWRGGMDGHWCCSRAMSWWESGRGKRLAGAGIAAVTGEGEEGIEGDVEGRDRKLAIRLAEPGR
jgi:hypothetical protein